MDALLGRNFGPWRIEALMAEGGMGRIYRATHVEDRRVGALKLLSYDFEDETDAFSRFYHEARAMAEINSPHLVRIWDFLRAGRRAAYVMEYLEGEDLARVLVRESVLNLPRVLHIAAQVCVALQHVHESGVVHRDIKPENIFLCAGKQYPEFVKLLDFGIAKYRQAVAHKTAVGASIGSPWYMSPEQAVGSPDVDGRSDQYGLGVIMYEMLSGRVPFEGERSADLAYKHLHEVPAPLRGDYGMGPIPERLARVVARTLEKDRDRRFPTMNALRAALEGREEQAQTDTPAAWFGGGGRTAP